MYGTYRDRTGDLRLAKLSTALRAEPGKAGITGESRPSSAVVRDCREPPGPSGALLRDVCGMTLLPGYRTEN
jgi:hypothetical protein